MLAGTFDLTDEFHEATKILCESIADIRMVVPKGSVEIIIAQEIWPQK